MEEQASMVNTTNQQVILGSLEHTAIQQQESVEMQQRHFNSQPMGEDYLMFAPPRYDDIYYPRTDKRMIST